MSDKKNEQTNYKETVFSKDTVSQKVDNIPDRPIVKPEPSPIIVTNSEGGNRSE